MDVSSLYQYFPTSPSYWTHNEIGLWLELLNMKEYRQEFEINKVDGLIIFDIDDKEIEDILGIKNSIHRKRLRNGINILRQFRDNMDITKKKFEEIEEIHDTEMDFTDNAPQLSTSVINSQSGKVFSIKSNNFSQFNNQTAQRKEFENVFNANVLANFEGDMSFPGPKTYSLTQAIEEEKALEPNEDGIFDNSNKKRSKPKNKTRKPEKMHEQLPSDKATFGVSHSNPSSMNIEEEEPKTTTNQSGSKRIRKSLGAAEDPFDPLDENRPSAQNHQQGPGTMEEGPGRLETQQEQFFQNAQNAQSQVIQSHSAELIIQPIDGMQSNNFYCINETGGRIGRHSDNEIVILEESVSRYHAIIEFKENKFFLLDKGSTTGSFIKIVTPLILEEDMILELGSNQFYVQSIIVKDPENGELHLKVIEGMHQGREFVIQNTAALGRKGQFGPTTITLVDDMHLSNTHTKMTFIDSKFILEDLGSTNGSWLRMSPESVKSEPFELGDGLVFKIGASSTFKVKRQNTNYLEMMQSPKNYDGSTNCAICYGNERDVVFIPCNHNVCCLKCSKSVRQCPVCRKKIHDIIRIYRA